VNHYVAVQPAHLNGRWQYGMINSRGGGGPICGCAWDEGHETREEAERHLYETYMVDHHVHLYVDEGEQRRCERCETWTQQRLTVRLHHIHDNVHVLCERCVPAEPDEAFLRELVPFRPGIESFGSY
jgi:hypothetical protein